MTCASGTCADGRGPAAGAAQRLIRAGGLALAAACLVAGCQIHPATSPPPTAAPGAATEAPPAPSPTPIVPASATPAPPTASPAPSATAPTASPPPAAPTPDPNLGVGASVYEDRFDGLRWAWTYQDEIVQFSLGAGQLNAVMAQPEAFWRIASGPDFARAGDQQVSVSVRTNLCYERDEYGLLFRNTAGADGKFNGYLFKLTCGGLARVEALSGSVSTVLLDWTAASAIVPGAPADNTLLVWAAGNQMHFYVNGRYLASASDSAYSEGTVGLYLRDRTNGGLSVSFADLAVKAVTPP